MPPPKGKSSAGTDNGVGGGGSTPLANTSGKALPLEIKLRSLFGSLALTCSTFGDDFSAQLITMRGDELAHTWAKLAQQNDGVKRVLTMLLEGSAWGETVMVTASVVIPIAWRYGGIPDKIGMPVTAMSGMMPVSREEESEMRKQGEAEQRQAAAAAAAAEEEVSRQAAASKSAGKKSSTGRDNR